MSSINKKIFNKYNKHNIDLMRFEAYTRRRVTRVLNELAKDLNTAIQNRDPSAPKAQRYQQKRLNKLFQSTASTIGGKYRQGQDELFNGLLDLSDMEAKHAPALINSVLEVEIAAQVVTPQLMKNIVNNAMVEGALVKDWWDDQEAAFRTKFKSEMRLGILRGEGMSSLSKRIQLLNNTSKRHADALVRTSFQSVMQKTRYESLKGLDVVKQFQFMATLDTRTTPICMGLDGGLYDKDLNPIGNAQPIGVGPPMHWGCRSSLNPITKSWEELGIMNRKKIPESTRASMDGQVPEKMTYNDWLKSRPEDVQKYVLGAGRYKLWKQGKITNVKQLTNQIGRPLTLEQLKNKGI